MPDEEADRTGEGIDRRSFIVSAASIAAAGGVAASYGYLGTFLGRFVYPAQDAPRAWVFVREVSRFPRGDSIAFRTPAGAPVAIARRGDAGGAEDFIALSSTCPHLGCQVHWEPQHGRFFCPCHNGTFDPEGKATGGPPFDAGQSLPRYPLKVEKGLLYIEVPLPDSGGTAAAPSCPGDCRRKRQA